MKTDGRFRECFSLHITSLHCYTPASFFTFADWLTEEGKCTTTTKIINPIQENRQTEAVVASCLLFVKEEGTLAPFAGGIQLKSNQHQLDKESWCT